LGDILSPFSVFIADVVISVEFLHILCIFVFKVRNDTLLIIQNLNEKCWCEKDVGVRKKYTVSVLQIDIQA